MKEVFLKGFLKWMPFHFIFFKNGDYFILPCIVFNKKNLEQHLGSYIMFGFLRWRMAIYFHNGLKF